MGTIAGWVSVTVTRVPSGTATTSHVDVARRFVVGLAPPPPADVARRLRLLDDQRAVAVGLEPAVAALVGGDGLPYVLERRVDRDLAGEAFAVCRECPALSSS